MAKYRITAPDGHTYEVTAPDDATQEQVLQYAQQNYQPKQEAVPKKDDGGFVGTTVDTLAGIGKGVGDVAMGAQHYLGKYADAIGADTVGQWLQKDAAQGREKLAGELAPHKARSPIASTAGEIGGNVAVTLPVGGALAKGAKYVPGLTRALPGVETALKTGGFRLGTPAAKTLPTMARNAATRMGAGAAVGGATAGLINPESAGTGAILGAAMPAGVKVAGTAGKLINKGGKAVVANVLGASTGTGADAVRGAYQAGKVGATEFVDNMRGKVPFDDVVARAKEGLGKMRADRAQAYRSGMVDIANDKTVLDFAPIRQAMAKVGSMGSYKGQQINKHASGTVQELADTVDEWAKLNPAEYHTPEGLDALKQAIGDIRDTTQFGTAARRAADSVYNSVKDQITKQAPTYSKVMKDYSEASALLAEVESALSLGNKAKADTAIRKLQSLTRNNAQTNYGNRLNMAKVLEDQGGVSLMPAISGQAMNSATPRGMVGAMEKVGLGAVGMGTLMNPGAWGPLLAAAPVTSPRLVGEALYGAGRLAGGAGAAKNQAAQSLQGLLSPEMLEQALNIGRTVPLAVSARQ